ncbi:hypothetical protein BH11PLA2_BH11PLA2_35010 [soil metagenome]
MLVLSFFPLRLGLVPIAVPILRNHRGQFLQGLDRNADRLRGRLPRLAADEIRDDLPGHHAHRFQCFGRSIHVATL